MSEEPEKPKENIESTPQEIPEPTQEIPDSAPIEEKDPYSEPYQREEKSINKGMIIGLIVAIGVGAFFAGLFFANIDSDFVTESELDRALSRIEAKIDNIQALNQPREEIIRISADDDPIIGDPNAPITIIEFSDYQCPFCARFHAQTLPVLLEEYIDSGKVNFVYRDFPIQSIHPNALPAAVAAECANEQDKFWEYHDILFENQGEWSRLEIESAVSLFNQYAEQLELSQGQFDSCLESGKYIEEIRKDLEDGKDYGVTGTPGFFIGNEQIGFVELKGAQPFESFKQVIDSQLNS